MNRQHLDTLIALCAVFISVTSLVLSLWSAKQQIEHDKLSVKPVIEIYGEWNDQIGFGWTLTNAGLGPAKIVSFIVLLDGHPQKSWEKFWTAIGIPGDYDFIFGLPVGAYYLPSQTVNVFRSSAPAAITILSENEYRVEMRACFCSLYGECWTSSSKISEIMPAVCAPSPDSITRFEIRNSKSG